MKKLLISIPLCLVLFSCKKDGDLPAPEGIATGQKYELTFNLQDFSPQVLGVKNSKISETPLKELVEHLVYIAYNEDGNEVSRIRQRSSGATLAYRPDENNQFNEVSLGTLTFGCFSDSLVAGNYTIAIIASQANFGISSHNEAADQPFLPFSEAYFNYEYVMMENRSRTKDTFFKKFQIQVEDQDITENIVLDRIVAKLELNILDARPEVGYRLSFINEFLGYRFSDGTYVDGAEDASIGAAEVIREDSKFTAFILNTDPQRPIHMVIEAFGPDGALIAKKTIERVPFVKNKRTVMTGNMHSSASAPGFQVTVNDAFDQDTIDVRF